MYPLNNGTTAAGYTSAATFDTAPTDSVFVQVNNAAVYYRVTTRRDGVEQPPKPERYLLPGKGPFASGTDWPASEELVKIEFRSAVNGANAQVSAS